MLKLGLTGSIATGKSTVLAAFAELGAATFSSDEAVHQLYADKGAPVVEELFPGVVHNGTVDRTKLSRRLVEAPGRLKELEAAIHPLVRQRIAAFLADAEARGHWLAVVDIPLLYENGYDWGLDAVAVTTVGESEQRRRALSRPGMTVEKLNAILARQLPQAEKVKRADYVIDTGGAVEDTGLTVKRLVETLRIRYETRT